MSSQAQGLAKLIIGVKEGMKKHFSESQWVIAEISDVNINRSGHCYLELIEKDDISGKIIAKTRATIWAFAFRMIKPYFETTTKESFRAGLKVLLKVSVEFHELYGFSLNVQDIDPQYTLGDMARKRAEIIERLTQEGVIDLNKELPFPMVPQRIAIISSETAAGYGDFMNQILQNSDGLALHTELFSAIMQGDKTGDSVSNALHQIFDRCDEFDAVVIIRGGGAKSELSSFDDYELAFTIAQFPLPVLTGIGHERDESIVDLVAHKKLKTPTAVAEFLMDTLRKFDEYLGQLQNDVFAQVLDLLDDKRGELTYFWERVNKSLRNKMEGQIAWLSKVNQQVISSSSKYVQNKMLRVESNAERMRMVSKNQLNSQEQRLERVSEKINPVLSHYLQNKEQQLNLFSSKKELLDPQVILNRGFAFVTSNSGLVKDASNTTLGEELKIQLAKGRITAQVKSKE